MNKKYLPHNQSTGSMDLWIEYTDVSYCGKTNKRPPVKKAQVHPVTLAFNPPLNRAVDRWLMSGLCCQWDSWESTFRHRRLALGTSVNKHLGRQKGSETGQRTPKQSPALPPFNSTSPHCIAFRLITCL